MDNEHKLCTFYEKLMMTEAAADVLGEEWKGYVVRIRDENDKQGLPMKQVVLTHCRVYLVTDQGEPERGRTSLFGMHGGSNLSVLNVSVLSLMLPLSGIPIRDPK